MLVHQTTLAVHIKPFVVSINTVYYEYYSKQFYQQKFMTAIANGSKCLNKR